MIKIDENALICDLAEIYKIYDYKEIAPAKVAIFAIGLRDNSRIKMKLGNLKYDFKTLLIAKLVDGVNLLVWSKTSDAQKGLNRPLSIMSQLYQEEREVSAFKSGKEFELEKSRILAERSNKHGY